MRKSVLYIFNPEHDLCLSNGDRHYVPPASALAFAKAGCDVMRILYGPRAQVTTADDYALWRAEHRDVDIQQIVPWGWDPRLRQRLLDQGADSSLLPAEADLTTIRDLQHRATVLPLQPHAVACVSLGEVQQALTQWGDVVLKSPWSGAGRGLRWVSGCLTDADKGWVNRVLLSQQSVIVERRFRVAHDFALEMMVEHGATHLVGYSLFLTQSGVYRHNLLLADDAIKQRVGMTDAMEQRLAYWVSVTVAPRYEGPLGIDLFTTPEGHCVVSEMNLRHTMGMVAHSYLQRHPEQEGQLWMPPR